jgi:hypothetical protein
MICKFKQLVRVSTVAACEVDAPREIDWMSIKHWLDKDAPVGIHVSRRRAVIGVGNVLPPKKAVPFYKRFQAVEKHDLTLI